MIVILLLLNIEP